jgi:type I restriction enzyme R subunit
VYSTNGKEIYEYSIKTASGKEIDNFPTPEELWQKTFSDHSKWKEKFAETPFAVSSYKSPRYYQENAISRALDAVAEDKDRILLTLATGTGKTYIAAQIAYKLYESAWSLDKDSGRRPRILFLADRNNLADQAMADFDIFSKDQKTRITPAEIHAAGNELPKNASIFFTIFQTLTGENGDKRHFEKYDEDFFDFIIIDECHRGGANDESSWREIMEYFAPAVQLGLTATPKRKGNVDTYEYFGRPVYEYSLKQGIGDGYLTPFKVAKFTTSLDEFIYTSDDEVIQGEIEEGRIYKESDFNRVIEIKEREIQRVKLMMDSINQNEKTIVFCANQKHASYIRDLINNYTDSRETDYCVRVTANDGQRGENYLKQFRNNEETIPTILTTSQKLSTGVDAMNLRNVVLFRPVNSMIEFKQIVGRGTRVFEGKHYFTILDFVKAYYHFADPEWDGEPMDQTKIIDKVEEQENGDDEKDMIKDEKVEILERPEKIKVQLGGNQVREMWGQKTTSFYNIDGKPISSTEFLKNIFGKLPEFSEDEEKLREIWANPKTRKVFLSELEKLGYEEEQLRNYAKLIDAENSDLFDVFEYIAFDKKPLTRGERILQAKEDIFKGLDDKTKEFLEFVLSSYHQDGYNSLSEEAFPEFLTLKYGSLMEANVYFQDLNEVKQDFVQLQEKLYV